MIGNIAWERADVENVWIGQPRGATTDGPAVTILGGVHGDEPAGVRLIQELQETLTLDDGTVYLIEGNPRAVEQGVRYLDENLNRCFRELTEKERFTDPLELPYEVRRAQALLPYLDGSRAALDVHNITLAGPAFIIAEVMDDPETMRTARAIGAEIISPGWSKTDIGGTDGRMFEKGNVGICYESGQKVDLKGSLVRAHAATARFLIAQQLIDAELSPLHDNPSFVVTDSALIRTAETFKLAREFKNFEWLEAGEPIATHGDEEIFAQEGQLIIFPTEEPGKGEEAFILGHAIDANAA